MLIYNKNLSVSPLTTHIPLKKVAIELNKKIVNKQQLGKIKIKKFDKIEIVHFIGGG